MADEVVQPTGGAPIVKAAPPADAPKKKATGPTVKWVVDHSMLGTVNAENDLNYVRGDVVTKEDLGEAFDRYKKLGAIKPYVKVDNEEVSVEE